MKTPKRASLSLVCFFAPIVLVWANQSSASASASTPTIASRECAACHSKESNNPKSRFPSGLGKWNDEQCVGCHSEINAIADSFDPSKPSRLSQVLPLSFEKLLKLKSSPINYTGAVAHPVPIWDRVMKYDQRGLFDFIKRPTSERPSMLAYPNLSMGEFESEIFLSKQPNHWPQQKNEARTDLVVSRDEEVSERNKKEPGRQVFEIKGCMACHGKNGTAPHYLGLARFQQQHIFEYANGGAQSNDSKPRRMPTIALNVIESVQVHTWLSAEKSRVSKQIDKEVEQLSLPKRKMSEAEERALSSFLFTGSFVRDASCVHCHSTLPRAKAIFDGTGSGLKTLIRRTGGREFWKRIATRSLEEEFGIVALRPGMPMAAKALDKTLIEAIGSWVNQGCRSDTEMLCK